MRLICPHCMSGVTVPDDVAGKEATCPNCDKPFPTPARYSAAVVPEAPVPPPVPTPPPAPTPAPAGALTPSVSSQTPAPPPGLVPAPTPAPSGFLPPAPSAPVEVPALAGYTKSAGITLSPKVIAVLPAVFLTLAFVLTFFPWVRTHYAGYPVYSQGPWRAIVGWVDPNPRLASVAPADTTGWVEKVPSDWLLMVPFLLLLFLAAVLALADRRLPSLAAGQASPPLPPQKIWQGRHTVIAALEYTGGGGAGRHPVGGWVRAGADRAASGSREPGAGE